MDQLDPAGVRSWLAAATALVEEHRAELDALNVFPVPDHDTGANVLRTLQGALDGPGSLAAGATGNSGIIVAEFLDGILAEAHDAGLSADRLRLGLRRGSDRAYAAVARPVEGTALTVAAAAAGVDTGESLTQLARSAARAAGEALLATREQLPELRRAGVVDAGGRAVCLLLDALVGVLTGEPARPLLLDSVPACRTAHARFRYEVQYVLRTDRIEDLRERLDALGDSVVTAPLAAGEWAVHVHADDAGAAIEAALQDGRPRQIRIEALPAEGRSRSLIVVAPGPVVGSLLVAEDVVVLEDDESAAIQAAAVTPSVVLVAAGKSARVYEAAAALRQAGVEVAVVPLRSPVQALSAVAVHDPGLEFADAVVAMAEAAAATRWGEVRRADQEAQTSAGRCRPGDVLGLAEDDVVLIGARPESVAAALLDKMLASSGELVTLLGGTLADAVRRHLADAHPTVEVQAHLWSGPGLLIGVE